MKFKTRVRRWGFCPEKDRYVPQYKNGWFWTDFPEKDYGWSTNFLLGTFEGMVEFCKQFKTIEDVEKYKESLKAKIKPERHWESE